VGNIPYDVYLQLLRVSAAHVYLTYPFVLSWSMLEAMAAQCLIIGSNTPPVKEVITHQTNGLLFDFFSPQELAEVTIRALERPDLYKEMREEARRTIIAKYDLESLCLPSHIDLIERLVRSAT
jgi:glycosyltransferase involved in cell wall biosynthesis